MIKEVVVVEMTATMEEEEDPAKTAAWMQAYSCVVLRQCPNLLGMPSRRRR